MCMYRYICIYIHMCIIILSHRTPLSKNVTNYFTDRFPFTRRAPCGLPASLVLKKLHGLCPAFVVNSSARNLLPQNQLREGNQQTKVGVRIRIICNQNKKELIAILTGFCCSIFGGDHYIAACCTQSLPSDWMSRPPP